MFATNNTPCADTDNNSCTTAGFNGQGVYEQNNLVARKSTSCSERDGNLCTTAGCNGQGVCDQNHMTKTCPPADECNGVCEIGRASCRERARMPGTDAAGNRYRTAGCELSPTKPERGG